MALRGPPPLPLLTPLQARGTCLVAQLLHCARHASAHAAARPADPTSAPPLARRPDPSPAPPHPAGKGEKNKTGLNYCQIGDLDEKWETYYGAVPSHVF